MFETVRSPKAFEPAPDGSNVYPLVRTQRSSVGIIELHPGEITAPVRHRSIEEVWYVLEGSGALWRCYGNHEEIVPLEVGTCVTIPTDASFQFRSSEDGPLHMLMFTVP